MPFIENPGLNIIAFDPGGTTGVAIWDALDQQLYVDQIDAGRGRKVRLHVFPNKTESPRRARVQKQLAAEDNGLNAGIETEMEILHRTEAGVTQVCLDLVMACGPRTIIVIEDYVVGWGNHKNVVSTSRETIAPVRLIARMRQKFEDAGVFNGDAWRDWDGFGAAGEDPRGIKMVNGVPMTYLQRLSDVERWRLGTARLDSGRALWAGKGAKWVQKMPGERFFLPSRGDADRDAKHKAWLCEPQRNQWRGSAPHGMDALLHLHVMARRIGCEVLGRGGRIWEGGEHLKGNRVSSKAASSSLPPRGA